MAFRAQHVYVVFDRDCLAEPEAEHVALLVEIENCLQQIESKAKPCWAVTLFTNIPTG